MRLLTKDEVDEILKIQHDDITSSLLKSYFGRTLKNLTPRFAITDYFNLPDNTCSKNIAGFTAIGLYLFNRLVTDKYLSDIVGYVNVPVTSKVLKKIYELISQAYYENKLASEEVFDLIDVLKWLGGSDIAELINVSFSAQLFTLPKEIKEKKDELFNKHKKELDEGNVFIAAKIEKELIDLTTKAVAKLPENDNFASGSKLSLDNNYKTMILMKGPVLNTGTGQWEIAKSNYNDGISKEEYALFADSVTFGVYSRAKGVAGGGYLSKKLIATLQDVETADKDTDCGTKEYLETKIDPYFKNELMYMYMIEGNKLVLLTPYNFDKYIGKVVKFRSPMYCKWQPPHICNKCVGEHPYELGLKTIGLATVRESSTLMNKRLKAFHDKKVYIHKISLDDLF